jgi:hypothetical protein
MIEIDNVNILRISIAKFLANFPEKAINLHSHAAIQVLSGELSEHLSSEFTLTPLSSYSSTSTVSRCQLRSLRYTAGLCLDQRQPV